MMKRNLVKIAFNPSFFAPGGIHHKFFSQAEGKADVTINLDDYHIDDRNYDTATDFEMYAVHALQLMNIGMPSEKTVTRLETLARAVVLRFNNDREIKRVFLGDERKFFLKAMFGFHQSCLKFGTKWFVPFLIETGLIDIVGIDDEPHYIDWASFAAIYNNYELLFELLSAGFSPKDPESIGVSVDYMDMSTDNTTTVVYKNSGWFASFLERCGFPANNTDSINVGDLNWMNDMSLYPGEDAARLRSNYLSVFLEAWCQPATSKAQPLSSLEYLAEINNTPLLAPITCADTTKAMRAHFNVRSFIAKLLVAFRDLVLSGADESLTLPHWLTPDMDKPLIKIDDTKAYGVLVLEDSTEAHRLLIENLTWHLDAFVIGTDPANGEPTIVHINGPTKELDQLPLPTFPDEMFSAIQ